MTLHEFEDRKRNVINGQLLNGNLNNNFEFRLFYFEINLKISFFFCSSPIVTQILSVDVLDCVVTAARRDLRHRS